MGFLSDGNALPWHEAKKWADYIRQHGIIQFLNIYNQKKSLTNMSFKWGDEMEYILVIFNHESKNVKVSLRGHEVLELLQHEETHRSDASAPLKALWRPEYGRFMVEGTPGEPYTDSVADLLGVELNMADRRKFLSSLLLPNEVALSVASFPMLGVGQYSEPFYPAKGATLHSSFLHDQIMHPHQRFPTLSANIRERRGTTVAINVPLFKDKRTAPLNYPHPAALPDHIFMDAMGFGMGCSCLQVTMQAADVHEARYLYDQLVPLAPIMLALTAASPCFRGLMADTDVRWNVISASVDDRTSEERGLAALQHGQMHIPKSRYASVSCYISPQTQFHCGDDEVPINKTIYDQLVSGGVDAVLARHLAHLFIRDPLVIYESKIHIDDTAHTDHFENIQSTNWQTVRFKPPPLHGDIGWRVEFRPMEVQLTDFENAAFAVFVICLARAITRFHLSFTIPITKVDGNMATAHVRDAVRVQHFHWRRHTSLTESSADVLMTINDIINGQSGGFEGLLPIVRRYLKQLPIQPSADQGALLEKYWSLISQRASGELQTAASWMRGVILSHPQYQQDSVLTDCISYDLLSAVHRISSGASRPTALFGGV